MSLKEPEPRRGQCIACGAPSQFVGEPCFFCGTHVYERKRSSLRESTDGGDGKQLNVQRGSGKLGFG